MALIVQKYGGTSMGSVERIEHVARKVASFREQGHQVVVVVSAMSGETDRLLKLAKAIAPRGSQREFDQIAATGEQQTIALLALALEKAGVAARSYTGWQVPIHTDSAYMKARIQKIDPERLLADCKAGITPVVAGFQGIDETGSVTTLGRGGSDTTGVALAAALKADECQIYTDVDGVYTTDPRVVPKARRLDKIAFEDMLELASQGAKVLQVRSVELGMTQNMPIFVRSSFDKPEDIDPHANQPPGTLICSEEEIMESHVVTGIAFSKDEAQISVRQIQDKPGVAASIFGPLAEANINVDMIVQNVSEDGKTTDLTFTVPAADYVRAKETITSAKDKIGYARIDSATDVAKISVIGSGMRSHAGVAAQAFKALSEKSINIRAITTSEIKFSVLIDTAYTELAVRTLHTLYGLDQA